MDQSKCSPPSKPLTGLTRLIMADIVASGVVEAHKAGGADIHGVLCVVCEPGRHALDEIAATMRDQVRLWRRAKDDESLWIGGHDGGRGRVG